jgi:hypothetical protein
MPKADLAVVKFKLSNNRNAKAANIAEPETQQLSPDDDYDQEEPEMEFEDDSPRVKEQQVPPEFRYPKYFHLIINI